MKNTKELPPIVDAASLMELKPPEPTTRKVYGPWVYYASNQELVWNKRYPIDLEDLNTSAQMLDTIFQIFGKSWCDQECIFQLLAFFEDYFHPQRNLCSNGGEKGPIDVRKVLKNPHTYITSHPGNR